MTKIIWTNGCFDILHPGHLLLFKYARSLGEKVIVGIDSDARVKHLKGNTRPVLPEGDRKFMLESLVYVDDVFIFNSERELELLIKKVQPSAMIVGEEYRNKRVIGHTPDIDLKFFEKIDGYSTTNIIQNITDR